MEFDEQGCWGDLVEEGVAGKIALGGLARAGLKGGREKTHFDGGLISVRLIGSDELSSADKPLRE